MNDSKNRKRVNLIKTISFIIIVILLMTITFGYCGIKDDVHSRDVWDTFYKLPDETLDFVILGGSSVREYYCAPEAYNHSGVASYALSTGNQPFISVKYLIDEVKKKHSPQFFVIDIRMLLYGTPNDAAIRRTTDGMKHSWNRIKLINTLLNRTEENNKKIRFDYFDHYFKFPMYHSLWEYTEWGRFSDDDNAWMGFSIYDYYEKFDKVPIEILETEPIAITEYSENNLRVVLDYCKKLDEEVIFLNVPSVYEEEKFGMVNYCVNIIENAGFEVLNLDYYVDSMNFDYATDFKDYFHANVWGAMKVTDYLADYLANRYSLPNHRGDKKYSIWQDNYESLMKSYRPRE